eukprot:TRINITY_DN48537_c0_g1_i1.p1 TRINITY_DN48537_c0_g1~~TRINITY_DN48537_c0_g1_i1.p1  ORF type:complete len:1161 (+),score=191.75 TRINITY_DN48537_c0_g1_i1:32-3484(+)
MACSRLGACCTFALGNGNRPCAACARVPWWGERLGCAQMWVGCQRQPCERAGDRGNGRNASVANVAASAGVFAACEVQLKGGVVDRRTSIASQRIGRGRRLLTPYLPSSAATRRCVRLRRLAVVAKVGNPCVACVGHPVLVFIAVCVAVFEIHCARIIATASSEIRRPLLSCCHFIIWCWQHFLCLLSRERLTSALGVWAQPWHRVVKATAMAPSPKGAAMPTLAPRSRFAAMEACEDAELVGRPIGVATATKKAVFVTTTSVSAGGNSCVGCGGRTYRTNRGSGSGDDGGGGSHSNAHGCAPAARPSSPQARPSSRDRTRSFASLGGAARASRPPEVPSATPSAASPAAMTAGVSAGSELPPPTVRYVQLHSENGGQFASPQEREALDSCLESTADPRQKVVWWSAGRLRPLSEDWQSPPQPRLVEPPAQPELLRKNSAFDRDGADRRRRRRSFFCAGGRNSRGGASRRRGEGGDNDLASRFAGVWRAAVGDSGRRSFGFGDLFRCRSSSTAAKGGTVAAEEASKRRDRDSRRVKWSFHASDAEMSAGPSSVEAVSSAVAAAGGQETPLLRRLAAAAFAFPSTVMSSSPPTVSFAGPLASPSAVAPAMVAAATATADSVVNDLSGCEGAAACEGGGGHDKRNTGSTASPQSAARFRCEFEKVRAQEHADRRRLRESRFAARCSVATASNHNAAAESYRVRPVSAPSGGRASKLTVTRPSPQPPTIWSRPSPPAPWSKPPDIALPNFVACDNAGPFCSFDGVGDRGADVGVFSASKANDGRSGINSVSGDGTEQEKSPQERTQHRRQRPPEVTTGGRCAEQVEAERRLRGLDDAADDFAWRLSCTVLGEMADQVAMLHEKRVASMNSDLAIGRRCGSADCPAAEVACTDTTTLAKQGSISSHERMSPKSERGRRSPAALEAVSCPAEPSLGGDCSWPVSPGVTSQGKVSSIAGLSLNTTPCKGEGTPVTAMSRRTTPRSQEAASLQEGTGAAEAAATSVFPADIDTKAVGNVTPILPISSCTVADRCDSKTSPSNIAAAAPTALGGCGDAAAGAAVASPVAATDCKDAGAIGKHIAVDSSVEALRTKADEPLSLCSSGDKKLTGVRRWVSILRGGSSFTTRQSVSPSNLPSVGPITDSARHSTTLDSSCS